MTSSQLSSKSFNPWHQTVVFHDTPKTSFHVPIIALDNYRLYLTRLAISYGTQIGTSFLLLAVLLLLTGADKRKSFIFITNALCLVVNGIRNVLSCLTLTGGAWNPYSQLSGDYDNMTKTEHGTEVATDILTLVLTFLIMASLALQMWVVSINTRAAQKISLMLATCAVGCVALGIKFVVIVLNIKKNLGQDVTLQFHKLLSISYIIQSISIWFFSFVFICKLGHAIWQRRRLRMTQFGPMQVLFIMGFQTMLIPALFTIFQFFDHEGCFFLGTQVTTILCISLPLSTIWAGIVDETKVASNDANSLKRLVQGDYYSPSIATSKKFTASNRSASTGTLQKLGIIETTAVQPSQQNMDNVSPDDVHVARHFGHPYDGSRNSPSTAFPFAT